MKKIASLVGLLSLVAAGSAFAQTAPPGINLAWSDCLGQGGTTDRSRACANAAGTVGLNRLYSSFSVPQTIPTLGASDALVDIQPNATTLPAWWAPSSTRFSVQISDGLCDDMWNRNPDPATPPGISSTFVPGQAPNRIRVRATIAFTAPFTSDAIPGLEYNNHVVQLNFNVGTFANQGCLTGACFVMNRLDLLQPGGAPPTVLDYPSTSHHATWTPTGAGAVPPPPCPQATPAKKATWGSIKALYR